MCIRDRCDADVIYVRCGFPLLVVWVVRNNTFASGYVLKALHSGVVVRNLIDDAVTATITVHIC